MTINHLREFLIRFQPLPLETRAPVVEEAPRPALAFVVPELPEGFLQQVGPVESLVGREQFPERLPAVQRQVLPARQQRVLLTLDVVAVPAA